MNFEEKKQAKIEYAEKKATQLKISSDRFFSKGFCETTGIPMGQPILIGHHSETRHRNAIKRYDNQRRKNIEDAEKAEYYKRKAERLKNDTTISSDDPEAITKLKNKMQLLEDQRTKIKEHNKKARKEKKETAPSYMLSNLAQNIRSVKERIKHLQKQQSIKETEETINNITLKISKEDNRVKLFFPGKPNNETRTKLKQNGFRWSPNNGCWQRMINNWSIHIAKKIQTGVI